MHWHTTEILIPDHFIGFVYKITNQIYIGRKNYWSITRKSKPDKSRKVTTKKESNWKTYTSSSEYVNQDIEKLGKENFKFEVLKQYVKQGELNRAEALTQLKLCCDVNGNLLPHSYNRQIRLVIRG